LLKPLDGEHESRLLKNSFPSRFEFMVPNRAYQAIGSGRRQGALLSVVVVAGVSKLGQKRTDTP
jgi:hypothetical protein